mgnify:CR=1 FL=1
MITTTPVNPPRPVIRKGPTSPISVRVSVKETLERLRAPGETWDQFFDRVIFYPWGLDGGVGRVPAALGHRPKEDSP